MHSASGPTPQSWLLTTLQLFLPPQIDYEHDFDLSTNLPIDPIWASLHPFHILFASHMQGQSHGDFSLPSGPNMHAPASPTRRKPSSQSQRKSSVRSDRSSQGPSLRHSIPSANLRESARGEPTRRASTAASAVSSPPKWWRIRLFRGMIQDVKRRAPFYWSDWTDAWDYRIVPATVYMYFAKYVVPFVLSSARLSAFVFYGDPSFCVDIGMV